MGKYLVINSDNKFLIEDILKTIKSELSTYHYDQYKLYPTRDNKKWQDLLLNRIKYYILDLDNTILWFEYNNKFCLAGIRFSKWDTEHFDFEIANLSVFYHSIKLDNSEIDDIVFNVLKYTLEKGIKFVSIRINGDDLDFIHAFENTGFRYIETVIWPVKLIKEYSGGIFEEVRLMNENELPRVVDIASNYQYQRGHFHCDVGFDLDKVNSLYAKWVRSAYERKENIVVIEHKGEVTGYFISAIDNTLTDFLGFRYGRMKSLALDPNYRGMGFGKKLFEGTCNILHSQGAEVIDSGYSTKNHLSAKLHTSSNFFSVYEELTLHKWI